MLVGLMGRTGLIGFRVVSIKLGGMVLRVILAAGALCRPTFAFQRFSGSGFRA